MTPGVVCHSSFVPNVIEGDYCRDCCLEEGEGEEPEEEDLYGEEEEEEAGDDEVEDYNDEDYAF